MLDTVFGLGSAVLMDSKTRGAGFIRSLFMLPIMTAPIVVALTWRAMFNNDAGWINYFLGLLHLPQPLWLGNPHLAMPAVIISDMWTGIPFQAILLLAGLLAVPQELKEAAMSDGANRLQVFWHVTLPSHPPGPLHRRGAAAHRRVPQVRGDPDPDHRRPGHRQHPAEPADLQHRAVLRARSGTPPRWASC